MQLTSFPTKCMIVIRLPSRPDNTFPFERWISMPVIDDIKQETKKFKNMNFKEKSQYIWDYYKIPIISGIVLILFAVFIIRDIRDNSRETYLSACMLNSNHIYDDDTTLITEYTNYADIDTEAVQLNIDFSMRIDLDNADQMSMAYQQKIMALFAAEELDVMVGDEAIISTYADAYAFADLNEVLPADVKAELEEKGYTYYMSKLEDGTTAPVGIYMEQCKRFKDDGANGTYAADANPIYTIAYSAPHPEHAIEYLEFLISRD